MSPVHDQSVSGTSGGRYPFRTSPSRCAGIPSVHRIGDEHVVGVGEYSVVTAPRRLMCIGLGSCVGVAIFDLDRGIGGLIHAMLPRYADGRDKTKASKYVDSAIMLMADDLVEMGASRSALRAKMAGGAQMFSFASSDFLNIGLRNCQTARRTLEEERILLIAEDVGGSKGRTVHFDPSNGSLRVQKSGEYTLL